MAVTDWTTFDTNATTRINDNTTQDVTPADQRLMWTDIADIVQNFCGESNSHGTQQSGFTPATANNSSWRIEQDRDFQQGMDMTSQDYVIFKRCRFAGANTNVLTTCDHIRFEQCEFDTVTGANGALRLVDCTNVTIDQCLFDTPSHNGISLAYSSTGCSHIRIRDCKIDTPTASSNSMITGATLDRDGVLFTVTGNHWSPSTVYAGIHVSQAQHVTIEACEVQDAKRTGIYIADSSSVRVRDCLIEDAGEWDSTGSATINDAGIVLHDCHHCYIQNNSVINYKRFGILINETLPAFTSFKKDTATYAESAPGLTSYANVIRENYVQGLTSGAEINGADIPGNDGTTTGSPTMPAEAIIYHGGRDLQILHNDIRHAGESGIASVQLQSKFCRLIGNSVYRPGRVDDDVDLGNVHYDGFEIGAAQSGIMAFNSVEGAARDSYHFKTSFGSFNSYTIHDLMLYGNIGYDCGKTGHNASNEGHNLYFTQGGTVGNPGSWPINRISVFGGYYDHAETNNVEVNFNNHDLEFFGVHCAQNDVTGGGAAACRLKQCDSIRFFGGFYTATDDSAGCISLVDSDGDVTNVMMLGVQMDGVDLVHRNWMDLIDLYANCSVNDPLTAQHDTCATEAETAIGGGRTIALWNWSGMGSSTHTTDDPSGLLVTQKVNYGFLVDNDNRVSSSRTINCVMGYNRVQNMHQINGGVVDNQSMQGVFQPPQQLLMSSTSESIVAGTHLFYVANGWSPTYSTLTGDAYVSTWDGACAITDSRADVVVNLAGDIDESFIWQADGAGSVENRDHNPVVGQIRALNNSTTQGLTTSYAALQEWDADGEVTSRTTPAFASDKIDLDQDGHYRARFNWSGQCDTAGQIAYFAISKDGGSTAYREIARIEFPTAGETLTCSGEFDMASLTSSSSVAMMAKCLSGTPNITSETMQLSIERIQATT